MKRNNTAFVKKNEQNSGKSGVFRLSVNFNEDSDYSSGSSEDEVLKMNFDLEEEFEEEQ